MLEAVTAASRHLRSAGKMAPRDRKRVDVVLRIRGYGEDPPDQAGTRATTEASPTPLEVRSAKTGRVVTLRGVGVLKARDLKLQPHVSLLRPIAEQALVTRDPIICRLAGEGYSDVISC